MSTQSSESITGRALPQREGSGRTPCSNVYFLLLVSSPFSPSTSPGALLPNTFPSLHPSPPAGVCVCVEEEGGWQPDHQSLIIPQAWIWRRPPITYRPRPTCASSKSSTTRTSSSSFPTSWRRIVSENTGFSRPPPGFSGTWHSSTLHDVPPHL